MTDATPISFTNDGLLYSSSAVTPANFRFHYGLTAYTHFYVSPFGFIKLGNPISSNNPALDTAVISALYNGASWEASYKEVGTGANHKVVINFAEAMQPTGEPTSYQIWLFPASGKIQLVYEKVKGYYGYPDGYGYRIFCKTNIMDSLVTACVKINPGNSTPSVFYSSATVINNNDSIYANTRLTFLPDTSKPAKPKAISFSDVNPGCFTVNITDGASNESMVVLERADSNTNYRRESVFYTDSPTTSVTYIYHQSLTQPDWTYHYRIYVSNGFQNSDTLYSIIQTPMPQINGIKKVPGDYPTITALLQDAACKHIGPNLIIELQNNYSFSAETLPLTFNKGVYNRLIQSIIIRPAANATINLAAKPQSPLIYVDSVKHIVFDGRAGGVGTTRALTIFQQNPIYPAIKYVNGADSAVLNYCNILIKGGYNLSGAISITPHDINYRLMTRDVEALHITNNFISADSATAYQLVLVQPATSFNSKNILIDGNDFSRFRNSAIYLDGAGDNAVISNNHFFQPEVLGPEASLPMNTASCISAINGGSIQIDNNFFGGNSHTWGKGTFTISGGADFGFINYQNTSATAKAFITNNKFGNITGKGYLSNSIQMLHIRSGDVLIDGNRFGTADSTASIAYDGFLWLLDIWSGTKTIRNNFFSGLQGDRSNDQYGNSSYLITIAFVDSLAFINNDVGGSDNVLANSSYSDIKALQLGIVPNKVDIRNNTIRGISSRYGNVIGLYAGEGTTNLATSKFIIDSNHIHHLQSPGSVTAMTCWVNTDQTSQISNNEIYALITTGETKGSYGPEGTATGIIYRNYNWNLAPADYKGIVKIFGNRIHSFDSKKTVANSIFIFHGIAAQSPISKIYNNEISFGYNSQGRKVDSLTSFTGIGISPVQYDTKLNSHHYIQHNSLYFGGKTIAGSFVNAVYNYNYVSDSSDVTVTNNIFSTDGILDDETPDASMFENISSVKAYSAKNIWYSSVMPNVPALLQSYQQSCNCGQTDLTGDPKFVNPHGDSAHISLQLGNNSAAEAAGTPAVDTVKTDIDGKDRNQFSPVDIGCYANAPCSGVTTGGLILEGSGDSTQLCPGGTTLTATVSGQAFGEYRWQKDLADIPNSNNLQLVVTSPGLYRITGITACGKAASQNTIVTNTTLTGLLALTAGADTICKGSPVTFSAKGKNIDNKAIITWYVNRISTGKTGTLFTTSDLNNNDTITAIAIYSRCGSQDSTTSNSKVVTVLGTLSPSVTITANKTAICANSNDSFVFTADTSGIGTGSLEWQVNGKGTGISAITFAPATLHDADKVTYAVNILTPCATTQTISSNTIAVSVNTVAIPSVSISDPLTSVCANASVTFTATVVNGGDAPTYQWQVNGVNTGASSPSLVISSPADNAAVTMVLTSSVACAAPPSATSNTVILHVTPTVVPQVSIEASATTICTGQSVTFTAKPVDGGTSPVYNWRVNNNTVGTDNAGFATDQLNDKDVVSVSLISSIACAQTAPVESNHITMTVENNTPTVTISGNTTVEAKTPVTIVATILAAGNNPSIVWQDSTSSHTWTNVTGANIATINYIPANTGDEIRCMIVSNSDCSAGTTVISSPLLFTVTSTNGIIAYPNPVTTRVTFDQLQLSDNWQSLSILSADGEVMLKDPNIKGKTSVSYTIQAFRPGLYLVVFKKADGESDYIKIIKE